MSRQSLASALIVTAVCAGASGSSVEAGWFHNPWGGSVATFGGGYGSGWYAYNPYSGPYGYSVGYVPYSTGYGAYGASTVAMSAGSSACCPTDCCATGGCATGGCATGGCATGNCGTPGSPCQVNSAPAGDPKPQPDTQVPRSNPTRDYDQPSRPTAPSRDLPADDFRPSRTNPSPAAPTFEDPAPPRSPTPDDFGSSPRDFGNPPAGGSGTRDDGFLDPVPGTTPGRTVEPMNDARPFGSDSAPMPAPVPRPMGTGTPRTVPPTTPGSPAPNSPAPVDPVDPFGGADPNRAFPNSPSSNPDRVNRPDLSEPTESAPTTPDGAEVTVPQKPTSESVRKVPTEETGAPLEVDPSVPAEAAPAAEPPADERAPLEEPTTEVPLPPGADEPANKDGQATVGPVVHVARRTIQGRFGNPAIVKTMVPNRTKQLAAPAELATIVSRDK